MTRSAVVKRITTELHRLSRMSCGAAKPLCTGAFACLEMVWGRVHTVLDSPVNREETKWSSTPKCRPPRAADSRYACHLSGLLKPSVFFRLPRRLTKQRLQATPTPIVMLLQSPSESGGCSAAARSSAGGKRPEAALVFFFKQKTAYEIMPSLVGSEMCIRDR